MGVVTDESNSNLQVSHREIWEEGTDEQTNGMIRRFIPEGSMKLLITEEKTVKLEA